MKNEHKALTGYFDRRPFSNIFYSCKAVKRGDGVETNAEPQIEDNVTRALLNVLCRCDNTVISRFTKAMTGEKSKPVYDFDLRRSYTSLPKPLQEKLDRAETKKLLLVIRSKTTPELRKQEFISARPQRKRSIPDGWLFSSNLVIAIESKTRQSIDPKQVMRHVRTQLKQERNNFSVIRQKTWVDVYDFFSSDVDDVTDESTRFVVEQFCRYLELCGLGRYGHFNDDDFAFLKMTLAEQDDQNDIRLALSRKLNALKQAVETDPSLKALGLKGWVDEGELQTKRKAGKHKQSAQAYFFLGESDSRRREQNLDNRRKREAHVWVQLAGDRENDTADLAVWACISNKHGGIAMERLLKCIEEDPRGLLETLTDNALEEYGVELYSDYERNDKWCSSHPLCTWEARKMTIPKLKRLRKEIRKWHDDEGLVFALVKYFGQDYIVGQNAQQQVKTIAEAVKHLGPFVQFVNAKK